MKQQCQMFLFILLAATLLSSCQIGEDAAPVPGDAIALPVVSEALAAMPSDRLIVAGVAVAHDGGWHLAAAPVVVDRDGLPVATTLPTSAGLALELAPGEPAPQPGQLVRAEGVVQPDSQGGWRLTEASFKPLPSQVAAVERLLTQRESFREQVVELEGYLMISPSSTLFVDQLAPGGVPTAEAVQIKVAPIVLHPALERLLDGGSTVRFGAVRLTAIWRDGLLVPLRIAP